LATKWEITIGELGSSWRIVKDGIDISSEIDKISIQGRANDISTVSVRYINTELNITGEASE